MFCKALPKASFEIKRLINFGPDINASAVFPTQHN